MAETDTDTPIPTSTLDLFRPRQERERARPDVTMPDGKTYAMRMRGEFSIEEQVDMVAAERRLRSLESVRDVEDADPERVRTDAATIAREVRDMLDMILIDCPRAVIDELYDDEVLTVIGHWRDFTSPAQTPNRAERRKASPTRSRGSRPSTGSRTRTTGS